MPVYSNRETERVPKDQGYIIRDNLLTAEQLEKVGGECTLLAHIIVEPHSILGEHVHEGEGELYFITEGEGIYIEDGVEYEIKSGDAMFCCDGSTHGIKNLSDNEIRFVAVILKNPESK